jgi:predicted metal-dependent phosphoesterase TrpH
MVELIFMDIARLESELNAASKEARLSALGELMALYHSGTAEKPRRTDFVNNHIHTIYSFSPYSPCGAAYTAWKNGLSTAGIMDHDSISGAEEFIEAGKLIGIAATVGFECRCKMDKTPFNNRRINNPDQDSVAYLAAHGIPHQNIARVAAWLAPYREKRGLRNRAMVDNINCLIRSGGLELDYDRDILPISQAHEGGSVTERHILYALAKIICEKKGKGQPVIDYLATLHINVGDKNRALLLNPADPMYEYYLLGELKTSLVEQFYIPGTDECPEVTDFIAFMREIGGISAYAYLGDVGDSVTGDKKAQAFEDAYLDDLIQWLADTGFNAVTYMPTRNTPEQLDRLMKLCEAHGLFQISGEDINTPFQSFICKALAEPRFRHLVDATWALIGHELAASGNQEDSMFSGKTKAAYPLLPGRIGHYAGIGRGA